MGDRTNRSGMRWMAVIVLGLVVVAGCEKPSGNNVPAAVVVPILITGGTPVSYDHVLRQLTPVPSRVAGKAARPIPSVVEGLGDVQKVADLPILALAEQGEWFFYATSVGRDTYTQEPRTFISGYAIKKGGQEILEWSAW